MSTAAVTIIEIDYHRNGVSGVGFYAVTFITDDSEYAGPFVATIFPPAPREGDRSGEPDWGVYERGDWDNPRVAVLALGKLPSVGFGDNSWRGDNYAPALYKAVMEYNAAMHERLPGEP